MITYLSKEAFIAINQRAVQISNDPHGVLSAGNLSHLVDAVQFKYTNQENETLLKAAFILDYIANKGHIFIEGNKRTAETATLTFLKMNGLIFEEKNQDELADFVLSVARNEKSLTVIVNWLKERIKSE